MEQIGGGFLILQIVWGTAALAACLWLGVHRPGLVAGPRRLSPAESNGPLAAMLGIVVGSWMILPMLYGILIGVKSGNDNPPQFAPTELIGLGLISYAAIAIALPLANRLRQRPLSDLGLRLSQLGTGLRDGMIAALIALPLVFWVGAAAEAVYQRAGYQHPMEHQMLRMILEAPPILQVAIAVMAVLLAPPAEELIFRGLLQTLIARALERTHRNGAISLPPPLPVAPATHGGVEPTPIPLAYERSERRVAWTAWTAIGLSSVAFAAVHEAWTIPPIFVLSLCLGYVYQRTGNLWSAIVLHVLFNAASTGQFLLTR